MYEKTFPNKRFKHTLEFLTKHTTISDTILDLGVENPFSLIMKEEGFSALYKGFLPKVLRLGPGGGILLVVFTGVMDFFRKIRDEKV